MVFLVANRTENGAFPFTILLFLTLFVCRSESNIQYTTMAGKTKEMSQIKPLLPYLQEEMKRKHVTFKLLWEEYVQEHPDDHYSLTQFRFHYNQNTEAKKESPSTILADMCSGGEKLFLDFTGDTMGYIDMETGEMVQCQTFVQLFGFTSNLSLCPLLFV